MTVQETEPSARAAAELLTQAAHDTDQCHAEAQQRADGLLRAARDEADRVAAAAQREADELLSRARAEVARLQQLHDDSRAQVRRHTETLLAETDQPGDAS